jgi:hypothetical protein
MRAQGIGVVMSSAGVGEGTGCMLLFGRGQLYQSHMPTARQSIVNIIQKRRPGSSLSNRV